MYDGSSFLSMEFEDFFPIYSPYISSDSSPIDYNHSSIFQLILQCSNIFVYLQKT